jgi:CheY-like chemotaxis protein
MAAHGGRIELESAVGRGSRFTVVFSALAPAVPVQAARAPHAVGGRIPAAMARDVLVFEDDPSAVRLLREYLQPAGYHMRVAPDGEQGLALAREHPPAAIILDMLLPAIDGWEVLRRLKADPRLRDIPVIIVTVVDEREVGLALGAVDYLVKPIQRDSLLACLDRLGIGRVASGHQPTVLAVDDEPAGLALVRGALDGQGYSVVVATSGREAIERVQRGGIDLVICDMVLPELDGFGVIAALKADPATTDIPILICTARDLSFEEKERLNGLILGIVTKGSGARDGLRTWLERAIPRRVSEDDAVA